uniref:Uncharacterized protein n=1 Tax=Arundo donax TaxID=35708 RepID=A0A0A9AMX0_ARUDO
MDATKPYFGLKMAICDINLYCP